MNWAIVSFRWWTTITRRETLRVPRGTGPEGLSESENEVNGYDLRHGSRDACKHDAVGWMLHDAWVSLSASTRCQILKGREADEALKARDKAVPNSGRNPAFNLDGASLGRTVATPPARPVTLAAVVARRRAVRTARYAGLDAETRVTLDGVAYASDGRQVLADNAIAWSERRTPSPVRRAGHCDAPVFTTDAEGRVSYTPSASATADARKRRKTPETAAKEIARAIENVASGKRPEGWARDRITKYAELFEVDVYDAQLDALDDALEARLTAQLDAPVLDGGSIQASRI